MGLNISGLVLNKNYQDNLAELAHILGEEFLKEEAIVFDDACESWKGDDYCDVYFSDKGTLVFLSMEKGGFEFCVNGLDTFSFVLSESTMMFCFNYTQNGELVRSYFESEDELQEDEGTPLPIEQSEEDKSEVIFHLIRELLGEDFHEVELEANCTRFWLTADRDEEVTLPQESDGDKPWWKIW